MKIGVIDRIPIIVAVQAITSSNIINNIERNDFSSFQGRTLAEFYICQHSKELQDD